MSARSAEQLSRTQRDAFFAHGLAGNDPASVAARIRTAIDLGVLTDGQVLPRESTFARQLGVTVFTLREALATLRQEGLLGTKVGRGGGSFVRAALSSQDEAARARLTAMSSIELRDLGDWYTTLAAACAELAAGRAAPGDLDRLLVFTERTADVDTAFARRSAARFGLELAGVAQSVRLSEAQIRLHEEFGDVLALPLADPAFRPRAAAAMHHVVDAIRAKDSGASRRAASAWSTLTMDELVRQRFALLARGEQKPAGDPLDGLAAGCDDIVLGTVATLRTLADDVQGAMRDLLHQKDSAEALARIHATATRSLTEAGAAVDGIGVMFEPGALPGHEFGGAWVVRTADGISEMHHPSDPQRDDFYDYSNAEWLMSPRTTGEFSVTGPYVDARGADEYIVTIAVPLLVDGRFLGVAGADLPLALIETAISPALGVEPASPCAIVNREGRVVVSNTAALPPGVLLDDAQVRERRDTRFGWSAVEVDSTP